MYIPKVGDVLKDRNSGNLFKILSIVDNFITYVAFTGTRIIGNTYTIFDFSKSFPEKDFEYPKEKFVPKCGERFCYPSFNSRGFYDVEYDGNDTQLALIKDGLVFATKGEAIEARDKMIKAIQ